MTFDLALSILKITIGITAISFLVYLFITELNKMSGK